MQPVLDFSKANVLRRVQEFPAPLCAACNVPMWVIKRDARIAGPSRFGYACHQCGESIRHRPRPPAECI